MDLLAATTISEHAQEYGLDHTTSYVTLDGAQHHYVKFREMSFSNASAAILFIEAVKKERQLYNRSLRKSHSRVA